MKRLYLTTFSLIAILFFSCTKDGEKVVMDDAKPELSLSVNSPTILDQTKASEDALTITYSDIKLGFDDALQYTLQIAKAGTGFSTDSTIEVSLDREAGSMTFTHLSLNSELTKIYRPAGQTLNYEFRIKTDAGNIVSNVVPLTITTYEDWPRIISNDFLYTPGAYQGWAPDAAVIAKMYLISGDKTTGKFEGAVNLPDESNEFKFTPAPNWDNDYGSVTNTGNEGTLQYKGGGNFMVTGKGYYTINLDLAAKTWKASLSNYSIIGDAAVDWNTDVDLEFDPATQTFFKVLEMKAGTSGWKFRKNHEWNGGDFPQDNLQITESGTYKVLLDMRIPSDPVWKVLKQ